MWIICLDKTPATHKDLLRCLDKGLTDDDGLSFENFAADAFICADTLDQVMAEYLRVFGSHRVVGAKRITAEWLNTIAAQQHSLSETVDRWVSEKDRMEGHFSGIAGIATSCEAPGTAHVKMTTQSPVSDNFTQGGVFNKTFATRADFEKYVAGEVNDIAQLITKLITNLGNK